MRLKRRFIIPTLAFLILIGVVMAFDQKFVSISEFRRKPLMGIFIYAPTALFAIIGVFQFLRGQTWPAVAFTIGLIATGLFHQYVIASTYGDPGYMFPVGHIIAPFISAIAYACAFLVIWVVTKKWPSKPRPDSHDQSLM